MEALKYFEIAKELNKEYHDLLIEKKLHFRGNKNSFSLISLAKETAEKGISNIRNKAKAISILQNEIIIEKPKRATAEKVLQAWIILHAKKNSGKMPFKENFTFITSELVFKYDEKYSLSDQKRDIRNDILAIDSDNKLCIIELKSSRSNEVKKQTIDFEKVVLKEKEFFKQLVLLYTNQEWNDKIRKISVWPKTNSKPKPQEYLDVEEVNYCQNGDDFTF